MNILSRLISVSAVMCLLVSPVAGTTAGSDIAKPDDGSKVLVVIPLAGGINQGVYRQVDRIVPQLKKISRDKIIRLECRYTGRVEREQDVMNAYAMAGKIEKYLRDHHKLNLDVWIGARLTGKGGGSSPALTFSVFSDDIRRLEKLPVDPARKGQEKK